jgi:Tol biopolymer transport system component
MGEVWKARDTRLDREIAIKISKEQFGERFQREARAVAALNHPNICSLYDVGPNYLVMELVEGAPLAPPGTSRKLLDLALQIADGLAAAHAAGIVHRDLKPGNILATRDGRVKILDFGLAKLAAEAASAAADTTRTMTVTDPGTTVGTVAYMSPEQARGSANLTPQSDQFSLGLVLYELCTGQRAFTRASAAETMTAIIHEDPEPLPAGVPAPLRWTIDRLLAKDPADRYDSTRDLYRELRQIRERISESGSAQGVPAAQAAPTTHRRMTVIAAVAAGLILGTVLTLRLTPRPETAQASFKFTPIARDATMEWDPAWSPDGKSIAYDANVHGNHQVFVKVIGSADTTQLTHEALAAVRPFWSADGATIYYHSGGGLRAVPASGGPSQQVLENVRTVALHSDGKTAAFQREGKVWTGQLDGGPVREFWRPPHGAELHGEGLIDWSAFSPDSSKLAVVDAANNLWILPYPSGPARNVGQTTIFGASWFPDSRHLAVTNYDLSGLDLVDTTDGSRRAFYRSPVPLLSPSISADGSKIACAIGWSEGEAVEFSLFDGRVRTVVGVGGFSFAPDWSPSGTHYLITLLTGNHWVIEDRSVADGFSRRVAEASPGSNDEPADARWSPDGTRFVFDHGPPGKSLLAIASASGGPWINIADISSAPFDSYAWSPDGHWIAFLKMEGGKQRLFRVRPAAGSVPELLANAAPALALYEVIQWSPRGDAILYSDGDGMSIVSPDGQTVRKLTRRKLVAYGFSRDGSQVFGIFHKTADGGAEWQLYSVYLETGAEKMLAAVDLPAAAETVCGFSLHPDGKHFLATVTKDPYDIWMMEGFPPPHTRNWLDRFSDWLRGLGRPVPTRS